MSDGIEIALKCFGSRRDRKRLKELLCSEKYANAEEETAEAIAVMANMPK